MKLIATFVLLILCSSFAKDTAPDPSFEMPLYNGAVPNFIPAKDEEQKAFAGEVDTVLTNVSRPTLNIFLPSARNSSGASVIICPGGGYQALLITREGKNVAREFNKAGITAFVLKYRLPNDKYMKNKSIVPLQDAQRAIQLVREHAKEWNIDPGKVGIMGFSAGGHLASTAGTHFDTTTIDNKNNTSLRPDFMILVNPVISFTDSFGHIGSRNNLLGNDPAKDHVSFFSNEQHIGSNTPPCFMVHSTDDNVVPVANSTAFFSGLKSNKVSAEMHLYAAGDHGFLNDTPPFSEWFGRCLYWMKSKKWID